MQRPRHQRQRRRAQGLLAVMVTGLALGSAGCTIGSGYWQGAEYCFTSIGTDWTPSYVGQPAPHFTPIIDGFLYTECFPQDY